MNPRRERPALIRRLAAEKIPLTVCPLSNVKLRVFDRIDDHNLKRLLDRGIRVTVNSDDPAYFGGYIVDNYVAVQAALRLTRDDMVTLARNSILASFLPETDKASWLEKIDAESRVRDDLSLSSPPGASHRR